MRSTSYLRALLAVVLVVFALAAGTAARADDDPTPSGDFDGKFHVDFIPYVWLPTINGSFTFKLSDLPCGMSMAEGWIGDTVHNVNVKMTGAYLYENDCKERGTGGSSTSAGAGGGH